MQTSQSLRIPKPLLVASTLVPSSGGLPKSIEQFRDILCADVVSFTPSSLLMKEGTAFDGIIHIHTHTNPLLEWYGYATPSSREPLTSFVLDSPLLVCNVMLRYHANWVMRVARQHNIPYWFVPHGQLDPYVYTYRAWIKHLWLSVFGKKLLKGATHVIFSTEQERKKAAWFYEGANTRVVHWPVELIDISQKYLMRVQIRKQFNIPQNAKVLLYFGRLHSMKNPIKTITVLSKAEQDSLHLIVVGPDGDLTCQECRQYAKELGIDARVHVTGPVYGVEKNSYLLGADAFISLSQRENFGFTTAESLAAATPVILSPGNDLSPELEPYRCGWFLRTDSETEASKAIVDFASTSDEALLEMGMRGRDFIANECSFEQFQKNLILLKEEAISA